MILVSGLFLLLLQSCKLGRPSPLWVLTELEVSRLRATLLTGGQLSSQSPSNITQTLLKRAAVHPVQRPSYTELGQSFILSLNLILRNIFSRGGIQKPQHLSCLKTLQSYMSNLHFLQYPINLQTKNQSKL